jgi:hypothetical protein
LYDQCEDETNENHPKELKEKKKTMIISKLQKTNIKLGSPFCGILERKETRLSREQMSSKKKALNLTLYILIIVVIDFLSYI